MAIAIRKEGVFSFWASKDPTGVYQYGSTGVLASGAGAMMARARGFRSFAPAQNEPELKTIIADGGILHSYRADPTTPASATSPIMVTMLRGYPSRACPITAPTMPNGIAVITMIGCT